MEIKQKGWHIVKKDENSSILGTQVYLDGKLLPGVQMVSVEIDAGKVFPTIKLELIPVGGLTVETIFGELVQKPYDKVEIKTFRSSMPPEEILKSLDKKDPEPEIL